MYLAYLHSRPQYEMKNLPTTISIEQNRTNRMDAPIAATPPEPSASPPDTAPTAGTKDHNPTVKVDSEG